MRVLNKLFTKNICKIQEILRGEGLPTESHDEKKKHPGSKQQL